MQPGASAAIKELAERICVNPTWVDLKGFEAVPDAVHHVVYRVDPERDAAVQVLVTVQDAPVKRPERRPTPTANLERYEFMTFDLSGRNVLVIGGAGYVGVGLRGTTGRLDDFGARTMGAPPPDTADATCPNNQV